MDCHLYQNVTQRLGHWAFQEEEGGFTTVWIDLEIIILSKSNRERKVSYDITYMWNLKKKIIKMNLFIKPKKTHRHRKQTYGYQRGMRVGG